MSDIQIYYAAASNITNDLHKQNIEIDSIARSGYKTFEQIKNDIKTTNNFCRDEESISINHLLGTLASNVILYAIIKDKVAGVLTFFFNVNKKGEKIINFDGICSPKEFTGLGIGNKLIDTLIRIGKFNNIKYINLECKGNVMKYYKNKFGFVISEQTMAYDSDDDETEPYYHMTLDLSTVSGGKKRKHNKKTNKHNKKTNKHNKKTNKHNKKTNKYNKKTNKNLK